MATATPADATTEATLSWVLGSLNLSKDPKSVPVIRASFAFTS